MKNLSAAFKAKAINKTTAPTATWMPKRRQWLQAAAACTLLPWVSAYAQADGDTGGDPMGSLLWPYLKKNTVGDAPITFTDAIRLSAPEFAEDPFSVPLLVDARALAEQEGPIARMVLIADRNPIQKILVFRPKHSIPVLGLRFRLEQASPVRALIQTEKGQWFVGNTWVEAAGGGCTASAIQASNNWENDLYHVAVKSFPAILSPKDTTRLRIQIKHPMDTGLVSGIPPFFIETLKMQNAKGDTWWDLDMFEPVSENPLFTFELGDAATGWQTITGVDNSGGKVFSEFLL